MTSPQRDGASLLNLDLSEATRDVAVNFVRAAGRHPSLLAIAAALTNIALAGLFLLFAVPSFRSNEDVGMIRIASGMLTGEPSEYLVHTNLLIGRVLARFYAWRAEFNWYAGYLFAAHFASMTGLLYAFLRRRISRPAFLAYLLVFAGFEFRLLMDPQFTSTAILAGASGSLMVLATAGSGGPRSWLAALCGGVLIVLSAMICAWAFALVFVILWPMLVSEAWRLRSMRAAILLCVFVFVGVAAVAYDGRVYSRDPAWSEFREFHAVWKRVRMHPALDREAGIGLPQSLGWSENDAEMFRARLLSDERMMSTENLRAILQDLDRGSGHGGLLKLMRRVEQWAPYVMLAVFTFCLAWFLATGHRLWFVGCGLGTLLSAAAVFVVVSWLGRLPAEAFLPSLCALSIAFLYAALQMRSEEAAEQEKREGGFFGYAVNLKLFFVMTASPYDTASETRPSKSASLRYVSPLSSRDLIVTLLAITFVWTIYVLTLRFYNLAVATEREFLECETALRVMRMNILKTDDDAVFVLSGSEFPFQWISPLSGGRQLAGLRLIKLGWSAHSPLYDQQLRNYRVHDLDRALYERTSFYLVCKKGDVPLMVAYMKEHYQVEIVPEVLYSGSFVIVKLGK